MSLKFAPIFLIFAVYCTFLSMFRKYFGSFYSANLYFNYMRVVYKLPYEKLIL